MGPLVRVPGLLLPVAWLSPTVLLNMFLVFHLFSGRKKKKKQKKKEKTSFEPHMLLLEATEAKLLRFMKHLIARGEIFPVVPGVYLLC